MTHWGKIEQMYGYEAWGVTTIPSYGVNQAKRYGRHWNLFVRTPGFKDRESIWAAVKPYAVQAGWTVVSENFKGGLVVVLHYNQDGVEAWANAGTDNPGTSFFAEIIEVAPPPVSLTLTEPAATPEKLPEAGKGDFAFLTPITCSQAHGGQEDNAPFRLTPKDSLAIGPGQARNEFTPFARWLSGNPFLGLSKSKCAFPGQPARTH